MNHQKIVVIDPVVIATDRSEKYRISYRANYYDVRWEIVGFKIETIGYAKNLDTLKELDYSKLYLVSEFKEDAQGHSAYGMIAIEANLDDLIKKLEKRVSSMRESTISYFKNDNFYKVLLS